MKNLFLSLINLLIVSSFNCFYINSQVAKIGAVHSKPTKFNKYLIIERDYPDASYWDIKILIREFDEEDSVFNFTEVQNTRMSKSFYQKIDSRFLNKEEYFITVIGYNVDDDIIVEEGPFPICIECQGGFNCQWGCIGKTYAYGLNLTPTSNGSSKVSMSSLSPSDGLDPYYYEWVSSNNWSSFTNNSPSYYGLPQFEPGYLNGSKVIVKTGVDLNDNLRDANNNICLGVVYGVRKYLGVWHPTNGNMLSNTISSGQSNCGQSFNWAVNTINDNEDNFTIYNVPELNCNGNSFAPSDASTPPSEGQIMSGLIACMELYVTEFDSNGNLINVLQSFGDCSEGTNSTAFEWPEFVQEITIFSMKDSTKVPIQVNKETFIDKDGNFVYSGFTLTPDFYFLGVQLDNGFYLSSYFERKDTTFHNLNLSNFLNYNPYPNPLTSNVYQIDFEATANVEFVYEVKNNLGLTVFSRSYKLDQNETLNDRISLTIPSNYSGFLYNTITFTDNSTLQFTMVK